MTFIIAVTSKSKSVSVSHFDHGAPEAYSIGEDPGETRNVFGDDPEDAPRLRELHDWKEQRLGRYLEFYRAQAP